ncbi:MAG TPA: hypothetical protein VHD88_08305 [Pyrinomonadaceae bacterium]|nr:hypothetical protein [Pyrinomonadaceae bacterium]
MKAKTVAVALVVACLLANSSASAQQSSTEPTLLALEVRFYPKEPPAYQAVPSSSPNAAWYARFHRIRATAPSDLPPVDAVNIKSATAGDGVRVWISVFFRELHEQQKDIAAYTLHEGEKISARELAQFGVDPFDISVVKFSPDAFDLPEVISKARSIDYVAIQPNISTLPSYRVAVRNLSGKNVRALSIQVLKSGQTQLSSMPQGKEGAPLILVGDAFEFNARVATRSSPTPTGYAPVTLPNQVIEISTAIFEDGSFEGDSEPALTYRAFVKGNKIQLRRVVGLFRRAIEDERSDPLAMLELLKSNIATLSLEADSVAAQEVLSELGQPVKKNGQQVKSMIEVAMRGIQKDALDQAQQFQLRNPKPDPVSFHSWLVASQQRYEAWLSRL